MLGLVNLAIERFVRETYGDGFWGDICRELGLGFDRFEPMLDYPPEIMLRLLDALCAAQDKTREEILEDIGTFLVSVESSGAVRRLLRFSGRDFCDLLYSLDDLPARARLAVPQLTLPEMKLTERDPHSFTVKVRSGTTPCGAFGHVVIGLLRAMADDYGALVLLEHSTVGSDEVIAITLLEPTFSAGREFRLGERAV